MSSRFPWDRVLNAGDSAMLLDFGVEIDPEVNARVLLTHQVIRRAGIPGLTGLIPAFATLLVEYDPLVVSRRVLVDALSRLDYGSFRVSRARVFEIPVHYGGDSGPDLEMVATQLHLSPKQVVSLHTAVPYRIYCLGFSPGFPLAGILPPALRVPRRSFPRPAVFPGAVAIAGSQTGIYPAATPGGWNLIGRTPLLLFDPQRWPPCAYQPGDSLWFRSISSDEYEQISAGDPAWPQPSARWKGAP